MGIMDKVKAQAEQAMVKAQQGVSQGQAKLEAYQQDKHSADALLRNLGTAVYAQQRSGGSADAVNDALAALDAHHAAAAAAAAAPAAPPAAPAPGSPPAAAPAAPATPATPAGGFNLDDV